MADRTITGYSYSAGTPSVQTEGSNLSPANSHHDRNTTMNKSTAILAATLIASSGALAEPLKTRGGYIGGAYGITSYEDDGLFSFDASGPVVSVISDLDEDGQAFQIYGGYRFGRYFALEGRYTNFGSYSSKYSGSWYGTPFTGEEEIEFSALTVNALGIIPFGNSGFDAYGQLGLGAILYESEWSETDRYGTYSDSDDDGAGTYTLGAGFRYTPPRLQALTVNLGYDVYFFKVEAEGIDETFNQSLSMFKLAAQYNF
jgi:hypothetical protein